MTDDTAPEGAEDGTVEWRGVNGANGEWVDPLEQRVHLLYAALARRDLSDIAAQLASEVVWEDARSHPFGGTLELLSGDMTLVRHPVRQSHLIFIFLAETEVSR